MQTIEDRMLQLRETGTHREGLPVSTKTEMRLLSDDQSHYCELPEEEYQQGQAPRGRGKAHLANEYDDEEIGFSFASFGAGTNVGTTRCKLLIDSGCTGYMIKDRHLFTELDEVQKGTVGNANNSRTPIMGTGACAVLC